MDVRAYKQLLLRNLYEPYLNCQECPLAQQGRTTVVFGEGNPDAQLMLVGEAPGAREDTEGRPFVGRSGKLLTTTLEKLHLSRQDIFITNVAKCRPPGNRNPSEQESETCKSALLQHQIKIIRPKVICTLGAVALQAFFSRTAKISQLRGKAISCKGFTLIPTFHPAYILRSPKNTTYLVEDLKLAISKTI